MAELSTLVSPVGLANLKMLSAVVADRTVGVQGTALLTNVGTTSATGATIVFPNTVAARPYRLTNVQAFGGPTGGNFNIKVFGLVNGAWQQFGSDTVISVPANTLVSRDVNVRVSPGMSVGGYSASGVLCYIPTGVSGSNEGFIRSTSGNVTTIPDGAADTASVLQLRFKLMAVQCDIGRATVASLRTALSQSRTIQPPSEKRLRLIFDGNSRPYRADNRIHYPQRIAATWDVPVLNFAVSGQTTTAMAADAATEIDPYFSNNASPYFANQYFNVLVVDELGNDYRVNHSATQTVDNMSAYCQARKNAGADAIWVTTLMALNPVDGSDPLTSSAQAAINAEMRSRWSTFADALVDFDKYPPCTNPNEPIYYYDNAHGENVLHDVCAAAIMQAGLDWMGR